MITKFRSRYNSLNIQARAAIWFVICSVFQKGISFITVPLFTRLLTEEEYGVYSLYLSWLQILTIITSLYLYYGVFNNGITKYEDDRDSYTSAMQGLTISVTLVVFLVYIFAYNFWSDLIGLAPALMIMMFVEMAVQPAYFFWSGRQRFDYNYKKLVAVTITKSILNPLLGLTMVLLANNRAYARVGSVVIVELVFCGIIMIVQFVKGGVFFSARYWAYALKLAIPLLPHYLSGIILNLGDRVMLDKLVGRAEVAYYSVAYSIGIVIQIVSDAIINSITPWFYKKLKNDNTQGIKSTVNALLIIISVVAMGLMMCSPELIMIFGTENYLSAVYVIPPVSASVFFVFLYNILAIPQFYFEKTKYLSVASVIAAIVNIVLNYIFIKSFGYIAAGYTTLICYVLYSVGHFIVSRKVLKQKMEGTRLYDGTFIFIMSCVVIIVCVVSNYLFEYWYIRYAMLLLIVIILYIRRKSVIGLFKGIKN